MVGRIQRFLRHYRYLLIVEQVWELKGKMREKLKEENSVITIDILKIIFELCLNPFG